MVQCASNIQSTTDEDKYNFECPFIAAKRGARVRILVISIVDLSMLNNLGDGSSLPTRGASRSATL
jgi:hypothetical protein